MDERISTAELIRATEVPEAFVGRLLEGGALTQDAEGRHPPGHAVSVRLAYALTEGGVGMDALLWAAAEGILPLDRLADVWQVGPSGTITDRELAARTGIAPELLASVRAAFGLGVPDPGTVLAAEEAAVLERFLAVWTMLDPRPEVVLRAARIAGEGVRRIEAGTLDLFDEVGGPPPKRLDQGLSEDAANAPSIALSSLMGPLMTWLHARHLEHEAFERIVRSVQDALAQAGRADPVSRVEPGVAFVDMTGFTQLTQAVGDERASATVMHVHRLAVTAAQDHACQVVKVLGDGVLLSSPSGVTAVDCVCAIVDAIGRAGLPPAHAGIASGPVIRRDGDIYGHTVNLAARIAAQAGPGEVLLSQSLADSLAPGGRRWVSLGPVALKGIERPVTLARLLSP